MQIMQVILALAGVYDYVQYVTERHMSIKVYSGSTNVAQCMCTVAPIDAMQTTRKM